jgi:hypothetical protein
VRSLIKIPSLFLIAAALLALAIATHITGPARWVLVVIASAWGIGAVLNLVLFLVGPGLFRDRSEKYRDGL